MPCTSEQIGLTSKPPQKLLTELNSLDNPTISGAKSPIPTNKAVPLSAEISSPVTPQLPEIVEAVAITNPHTTEIVKAVPITNPDATEIIEAVAVANPDATETIEPIAVANPDATETIEPIAIANPEVTETVEPIAIANSETTEIVEAVPIANSETTEIIEAVAIANPDATEIVEAVTRATGGMNPELKTCVLQHSLNEIQVAINLLHEAKQSKYPTLQGGSLIVCAVAGGKKLTVFTTRTQQMLFRLQLQQALLQLPQILLLPRQQE
jgi:hypothetical protein